MPPTPTNDHTTGPGMPATVRSWLDAAQARADYHAKRPGAPQAYPDAQSGCVLMLTAPSSTKPSPSSSGT